MELNITKYCPLLEAKVDYLTVEFDAYGTIERVLIYALHLDDWFFIDLNEEVPAHKSILMKCREAISAYIQNLEMERGA